MGLFSMRAPIGNVTEYIPVPVVDRPGFVMVFVLTQPGIEAEEEGCFCCLTKNDEYQTGFSEFFKYQTGTNFRDILPELHEYCGATVEYCKHAETKDDGQLQREFEYLIFPDMKSFLRGQEWFEARWVSAKLEHPEK